MADSGIRVFDNVLPANEQGMLWQFLNRPGWAFGAYSENEPDARRYFYKHFAGYVKDGKEKRSSADNEDELVQSAPMVAQMWNSLKKGPLQGQGLARCYANGMPGGVEGGLHCDSNIDAHLTVIYYPHPEWNPGLAGETLFFNKERADIIAAVYPRPNRLVIFPGTIPHVARPMSQRSIALRITLMFKTQEPDPRED